MLLTIDKNIIFIIVIAVLVIAIAILVFLLMHEHKDLKRIQSYHRQKQQMNPAAPYPAAAPHQAAVQQTVTPATQETSGTTPAAVPVSGDTAEIPAAAVAAATQGTASVETDKTVTLTQAPVVQAFAPAEESVDENKTTAPRFSEDIENYLVRTAGTVRIGKLHGVGKRENQQDSLAYSDPDDLDKMDDKGFLAIVGDGMGGLSNGAEISQMVVASMLEYFDKHVTGETDPKDALLDMVEYANRQVCDHIGEDRLGTSGSTVVAALWRDHKINWISVGDSSIFLLQNGIFTRLNDLHNFGAELDELAALGQITEEEARTDRQRAALTSYMGMGPLKHISQSAEPIELRNGDRLILASDGIYSAVSSAEIQDLLRYDVEVAAMKLRFLIEEKGKRNQDNYTAMIIEDHYM